MSKFNIVLKSLRASNGMTQDQLAKALKISRSTIGMYEKGDRKPDPETLEAIADYFNIDTDYLLGRTNRTTRIIESPVHLPTTKEQIAQQQEDKLLTSFSQLTDENKKKCISYTENLLTAQKMEEELLPVAAHARTDIKATKEDIQHDLNLMNDDNWE